LLAVELSARRRRGEEPGPEEYRVRLPGDDVVIEIAFAATTIRPSGEGPAPSAGADDGDRTTPQAGEPVQAAPRSARGAWPVIAGYEILQRVGEGGMGDVYKARHRGLNRLVALKMIRGGTQARVDHLARFRIEAEAVARLRHPNILQIYDI